MRSVAVNAERLALVAVRKGIHTHVRHSSPHLLSHLGEYVASWRAALREELESASEREGASHMSTTAGVEGLSEAPGLRQAAELALMRKHAFGFAGTDAPKVS